MIFLKEMIRLLCFFILGGLASHFDAEAGLIFRNHILKDVDQLVVVVTDGWDSSEGKLMCYIREGRKSWRPEWKKAVPVPERGRTGSAEPKFVTFSLPCCAVREV